MMPYWNFLIEILIVIRREILCLKNFKAKLSDESGTLLLF